MDTEALRHALSPVEATLKQLYVAHPDRMTEEILPQELPGLLHALGVEGLDLPQDLLAAHLEEAVMFQPEEHVAIVQHLRYLPPLRHTHQFMELLYVQSGTCTHRIGPHAMTLRAGDLGIIAPGHEHSIAVFDDDTLICNVLVRTSAFDTVFFGLLTGQDVLSRFFMQALYGSADNACLIFRTGDDPRIADFVAYLLRENHNRKKYYTRMMNNVLEATLIELLRTHEDDLLLLEGNDLTSAGDSLEILRYVQVHYTHLTLSALSDHFHYSERHMGRLIKNCTGMSASELIRTLKLKKAAVLLESQDLSIAQILERIGYIDLSSFYRAFRQHYGMTPVEYRQLHDGSTQ